MNRFRSLRFPFRRIRLLCAIAAIGVGLACSAGEENPADEVSELARPIELTDAQIEAIEKLENIGYMGGGESSMDQKMVGVLKYDPEAVRAGLNLFASGHAPVAILMDMEGRELHQWETTFMEVFPDAPPPDA